MEDKVKSIIFDNFGISEEDINDNAHIVDDLGLDSLDMVELIMACEEEFDIEIADEEVRKIKTFKDTIIFLEQKLCKKQDNR